MLTPLVVGEALVIKVLLISGTVLGSAWALLDKWKKREWKAEVALGKQESILLIEMAGDTKEERRKMIVGSWDKVLL
jgi:hypothetical protein